VQAVKVVAVPAAQVVMVMLHVLGSGRLERLGNRPKVTTAVSCNCALALRLYDRL